MPDAVETGTVCRISIDLTIEIRLCVEDDLPALEWDGKFSAHRPIIKSTVRAQTSGRGAILLADANRYPVGQVWIDFARERDPPCAFLWAVRVLRPFRRAGIGSRLMASAEAMIRRRSISKAELTVEAGNRGARRFYERLGYRVAAIARAGDRPPWHGGAGTLPAFDLRGVAKET